MDGPSNDKSRSNSTASNSQSVGGRRIKKDQKLPPQRRVQSRRDFLRIQQSGEKFRSKFFLVAVSPRCSAAAGAVVDDSRIGITVTTKVHKRAVMRNRLKRRLREVFRRYRARFERGCDVVVIALNGAVDLDYRQVEREFCWCLRRAGLLPERGGNPPKRSNSRPQDG